MTRDVAQALGYALPSKAVLDHFNYAKILKYANSAGLTSSPMPSPSSATQRFRIGTFDFQLRGLSIISEADVYGFFMRPHFTEAHGNVAPNLEAYEVVSQLIFGQSKIAFTENFLPPNLGDYGVACHTSEAPGLPALQGRLPSPQDGRVAIGLLPLAGLLLRRADMLDKGCPYHGHTASVRPTLRPCCSGCPKPFSTGFHPLCLILRPVRMAQPSAWGFFCRAFPVPAVTRLQVAEIFGKRHDHVLREIEYILTQAPEIFIESNFGCNEAE